VFVRPYTYGLHCVNKQERQRRNKKILGAFAFLLLPCIAINMVHYELVPVALHIQNAKCMCHNILSSVTPLGCAIFFHINFGGKKLLNIDIFFIFRTNYVSNISYSKKNSAR